MSDTITTHLPCPVPGLHRDVPAHEYHAWNALACGVMLEGRTSMRHLQHARTRRREETAAMRLGTLAHAAILEPRRFLSSIVEPPINPKTGKPYGSDSQAFADYMAERPGKLCLANGDVDRIQGMIDSVQADPLARGALFAGGRVTEASIVFDTGPGASVRFKVRPDCLTATALVDLKTVRLMSSWALGDYAWKAGWYHRAVMYQRGLASVRLGARDWLWVIVDNEAPYDVQVLEPETAALLAAEQECETLLAAYCDCLASGVWPGKRGAEMVVRQLAVPAYVLARAMAEAENAAAFEEIG